MKNIYDDEGFFQAYAQMERSEKGLQGAGEWHQFCRFFPEMKGKKFWISDAGMDGIVPMQFGKARQK